jgi:hypothetical protein
VSVCTEAAEAVFQDQPLRLPIVFAHVAERASPASVIK